MAIGDWYTLKIVYQNTVTGVFLENQLHYQHTGVTPAVSAEADLVAQFRDDPEGDIISLFHGNYSVVGYRVIPRPGNTATYDISITPVTGFLGGDVMPPANACIVSIKSESFTRSGRGRIYLPPAAESNSNAGGQVAGAYITDVNTFMAAAVSLTSLAATATFILGIWSEKDQAGYQYVSYAVRNYWGVQRGRRF